MNPRLKHLGLCLLLHPKVAQHISRLVRVIPEKPGGLLGDMTQVTNPSGVVLKSPTCWSRLRLLTAVLVAQPNRQAQGLFPIKDRVGGYETVLSCNAGALSVAQLYHKSQFCATWCAKAG